MNQSTRRKDSNGSYDGHAANDNTHAEEQPTARTALESTFFEEWKDHHEEVEDSSVITFDLMTRNALHLKDEESGSFRSYCASPTTSRSSLRTSSRLSEVQIHETGNSRYERVLEELTINKLNISSLGVVGRNKEKWVLQNCFERLCQGKDGEYVHELVLIKGYSGIGKSVLARTIQKKVETSSGVYVEGKYEFTSTDEPYSGISQAFGKLCNKFKDCPSETRNKISSAIKENLREEAFMLMGMIPEISVFLDCDESRSTGLGCITIPGGREHERWKYAFRTFTRILGSHFSPIVMVLDDLQWADISSLDILDHLLSDFQNPHLLMIVGCYRSNEVDENSILFNRIQTLEGKCQKGIFRLTDIELQNCDVDSVNKIIMSMMDIDDESETRELAEVCFKRTLGNPFFLIEFMRMLHSEGCLEFSLGLLKWKWEVAKIENMTMSTDNVVDLLKSRMSKLSNNVQLLLQYAACLGASFSISILEFVWNEYSRALRFGAEGGNVESMMKTAQNVQLVESCGAGELRWVHDKVQEAALSLSNLVTPSFRCSIGMFLFHGLDPIQLEKQVFEVADLVNKGGVTGLLDVAVLNLQAAEKARKIAALQSAAKYAEFGIAQLPMGKWKLHRGLTLQLYSLGAEVEYALGHINKAEEYIAIILNREDLTAMETLPLKKMKAQILATAHLRWHEACDYGLVILKDLGYNFVWSRALVPVQMLMAIKNLAKRVKKVKVEDVENMKVIKDEKQRAIIDILKLMKHLTYSANTLPLCFLCVCKVIEMTLDHGLSLCSADCFATFGGVLMFLFKDHAAASHVCDLAFAFQNRSGRRHIADTMHGAWAFVLVQTKPLHEGLHLTMKGYSEGVRDGDPLDSTNCLINRFVLLPYMMGRSLESIIEQFPKIAPQLEESGITNNILTLKVWWQMMLNLQLPSVRTATRLEGEKFRQSEEKAESNMYIGNVNLAIGELLLFFGEHEERAKRLLGEEKGKTYSELVQGYPPHGIETFHRGITWYAMARKTGKRKYQCRAAKVRKEITKWVKKGNPNAKDYDLFLRAEQAVLDKKYDKANTFYKKAIVHAARIGHLSHVALYNERFAEYRLEVHGDGDDYEYYMTEAMRYYAEWGAHGKGDLLKHELYKIHDA
ncbi:unnamed protein product [Cylindrotheca closterium]|uniref:Orc1-like AAA ATPase domain-containing protein n=1 Tax=Cylindrotheca closterium TaxID=2856 RepID=A0AAD2JLD4_9STRA|nr:unnamed protein product [Cylindrotheca closterium]